MAYGTIKVDTITFTAAGVDTSVTISGLVQNPTFSGNITVTGTVSGNTIEGQTVSGATVTGDIASFTTVTGGVATITSGVFALGTDALPSLTFTGDLNTGIYSPGADQLAISTAGSGRLFVDSTGKVGIGGASVAGLLQLKYATDVHTSFRNATAGGLSAGTLIESVNDAFNSYNPIYLKGSQFAFGTDAAGSFVERLRITSTGTVNIVGAGTAGSTQAVSFNGSAPVDSLVLTSGGLLGVGTSSPSTTLEINGITTIRSGAFGQGGLKLNYTSNVDSRSWYVINDVNAYGDFAIQQSTTQTGSTYSTRLCINPSGNVGIGTSDPSTILTIQKNIDSSAYGSGTQVIDFKTPYPGFDVGTIKSSIYSGVSSQVPLATNKGYLAFLTHDGTSLTEKLRIESNGSVGIGTSPAETLHLGGTSGQVMRINGVDTAAYFGAPATNVVQIALKLMRMLRRVAIQISLSTRRSLINQEQHLSSGIQIRNLNPLLMGYSSMG